MAAVLKTFFREAFGAAYGDGCEPNCMYDNYATVGWLSDQIPRAVWLWFVRPLNTASDGNFLHPLPLQVAIAQNGARAVRVGACGRQLGAPSTCVACAEGGKHAIAILNGPLPIY
jgi:hypothetical protein